MRTRPVGRPVWPGRSDPRSTRPHSPLYSRRTRRTSAARPSLRRSRWTQCPPCQTVMTLPATNPSVSRSRMAASNACPPRASAGTTPAGNGTVLEIGPGDAYVIEPGHDAEILGEERFVGFEFEPRAAEEYAR